MPKGSKKRKNERKSKESFSPPSDGINVADTHQDMAKSNDKVMCSEVVAEAKLPAPVAPVVMNKLINSFSASGIHSTKELDTSIDIVKSDDKVEEVIAEANTKDFVNLNKDSIDSIDVVVMSVDNVGAISEPVAKVEQLSILTVELSEPNCNFNKSDLARKQQLENIRQKLQDTLYGVEKLLEE